MREATAKALIAAVSNISFYEYINSLFQYVRRCNYRILSAEPNASQLENVKTGKEILIYRCIYFMGEKPGSYEQKKLTSAHHSLLVAKPTGALIVNADDLNKTREIAKQYIIEDNDITQYINNCHFRLMVDHLEGRQALKFLKQNEILLTKVADTFTLFFLNKKSNSITITEVKSTSKVITEFDWDKYVKAGSGLLLNKDDNLHKMLIDYLTDLAMRSVIRVYSKVSRNNISKLLDSAFNGLIYDESQLQEANVACLMHLHHLVKEHYEKREYDAVVSSSKKYMAGSKVTISETHRLPPYFAWQIINLRLATYAESKKYLLDFKSQYEKYSQYIYDSAPQHWLDANGKNVHKNLKNVLRYALQQFVIAAVAAESTPEEKKQYLSNVTYHYRNNKEWDKVLKNDEMKFVAAYTHFSLGNMEESMLFLRGMTGIAEFLVEKKKEEFTRSALIMLAEMDSDKHLQLLLIID